MTEPYGMCKPLVDELKGDIDSLNRRVEQWQLAVEARDNLIGNISGWIANKKNDCNDTGEMVDINDLIALDTIITTYIKNEQIRVLKAAIAAIGDNPMLEFKRQDYEDQLKKLVNDE